MVHDAGLSSTTASCPPTEANEGKASYISILSGKSEKVKDRSRIDSETGRILETNDCKKIDRLRVWSKGKNIE